MTKFEAVVEGLERVASIYKELCSLILMLILLVVVVSIFIVILSFCGGTEGFQYVLSFVKDLI